MWLYQTMCYKGTLYCLTRLGRFILNVAPLIMKAVLDCIFSQDPFIQKGTSAYIDDISLNEDIIAASNVEKHLETYGLTSTPRVRLAEGGRTLCLRIWGEQGDLFWRRDNAVPVVSEEVKRRNILR